MNEEMKNVNIFVFFFVKIKFALNSLFLHAV